MIRWLDAVDEDKLYISAITIGEIQRGIAKLPESRRKVELQTWLNEGLLERFTGRILPLDAQTLLVWGNLSVRLESTGQPVGVMDGLIAAVALQHNLTMVTRNVENFIPCGVQVLNPWE